jgi:hypothetical protein
MSTAAIAAWAVFALLVLWMAPALAPLFVLGLLRVAVYISEDDPEH